MLEDGPDMSNEDDPDEGRGAVTIAVGAILIFALAVLYCLVQSR
jgi:hypothetical protein